MDTLCSDLVALLDKHLNCYQCVLLGSNTANSQGWALYLYDTRKPDNFMKYICSTPTKELLIILNEVLKLGSDFCKKTEHGHLLVYLGFYFGDLNLIETYSSIKLRAYETEKYYSYIRAAIRNNHTDIVLKCYVPFSYTVPVDYNGVGAEYWYYMGIVIDALQSGNQRIIDHIIRPWCIDDPVIQLLKLAFECKNQQCLDFFNTLPYNGNIVAIFSRVLCITDNGNVHKSLISKYGFFSWKLVDWVYSGPSIINSLLDAVNDDFIEECALKAYASGFKILFNKLVQLNSKLIDEIDICTTQMRETTDIEILKLILHTNPPSIKDVNKLITKSLESNRYDIYMYLCSVKYIIIENNKHLRQQIHSISI